MREEEKRRRSRSRSRERHDRDSQQNTNRGQLGPGQARVGFRHDRWDEERDKPASTRRYDDYVDRRMRETGFVPYYRQERFRHLRANDPKFRNKAPSANSRQRMEQARERGDEEGSRKIGDGSMRRFAPPGKTLSDLD